MNRQDFGEWGIELKSGEFAGALVFLLREFYRDTPADVLAKLIGVRTFKRFDNENEFISPIEICFDVTYHLEIIRLLRPASEYYRQWLDFVETLKQTHTQHEDKRYKNSNYRLLPRPFYLRLELYTNSENAYWLTEQFLKLGDNEVSVYLRTDEPAAEVGWNWALRVGFLNNEDSRRLRGDLEKYFETERQWLAPLIEFVNLSSENDNCDVLLLPASLRSAIGAALTLNIRISADCTLVIGQTNENPEDVPALIDTLRRLISTAGIGIAKVQSEKINNWFTELIRELSHDEPIDVALFAACRRTATPPPFLIASRQLIRFSRLVESIKSLGEKLKNSAVDKLIDVSGDDAYNFGIEPRSYNWNELGEKIVKRSNDFRIDREITSATSAVKINKEFQKSLANENKQKPNQTRWIQAQIFDSSRRDKPVRLRSALRANAPHELMVRIGTENQDWEQSDEKFPAELLPPGKESYRLTVIITEPQLFDEPQISEVVLPPEGDSSECRFFFHVGENIKEIEARISILYKNRVLQTALLKAAVVFEPSETSDDFKITMTREAIVRADFSGLKERRYFDAAFILNEDSNHNHGVTAIKDQYVAFSTPEGLTEFNKQVDKFLTDISDDPNIYTGKLDNPATVKLLSNLAKHGRKLYKSLTEYQKSSPLANILIALSESNFISGNPKRIQIISAKPDTRLPFEFLYDRAAPTGEKTKLCPNAVAGLEKGACFTDCPGIASPEDHVCPLGFWGLSNIIERHTHSIEYSTETLHGDFRWQTEPLENRKHLEVFRKVLFAASNKADVLEEVSVKGKTEIKKGGVEKIGSALSAITNSKVSKINSWRQWSDSIKSEAPSALILLTHTKTTNGNILALEIEDGTQPDMLLESIEPEYVYSVKKNLPPIVLLIGCETGKAKIEFMNFVAGFRQCGATIIVSTGTTILGRHAIPVTFELLKTLDELTKEPNRSFGEAMRLIKQKMLARGIPMVLTLMSYGDADWQIGIPEK